LIIDGVQTTSKKKASSPATPDRLPLSPSGRGSVVEQKEPDQLLGIFARNVRVVRRSQALSQEALADLSDLDRTYVSGIERGLRNVSIRNIQRIAVALDIDPRELLNPELASTPKYKQFVEAPPAPPKSQSKTVSGSF